MLSTKEKEYIAEIIKANRPAECYALYSKRFSTPNRIVPIVQAKKDIDEYFEKHLIEPSSAANQFYLRNELETIYLELKNQNEHTEAFKVLAKIQDIDTKKAEKSKDNKGIYSLSQIHIHFSKDESVLKELNPLDDSAQLKKKSQ